MNKLYSSRFQVEGAGDLTLSIQESRHNSIGVDAQEQLEGFEPKAFSHTFSEHSPHPASPGA